MPFGSSFHPTMVSHVAALLSIEGSVPQRPGISLFAPPEVDQVDLPSSKLTETLADRGWKISFH